MTGKTISHFKVLEKLGGGGMGVVYEGEDLELKRPVALKFLPPHLSTDEDANRRFIQEAQAASALNHANICTVYEIGRTDDGQHFIAMAHYEGETLKTKLDRGALPAEEAVDIARQIAEGLAAAHDKGIVHRDIKPANILVTERGRAIILDFGLAKLTGSLDLTKSGSTLGTAFYMSPEQIRNEPVDGRTDIWSLGVVLFEMLSGQRPFQGEYEQAVSYAILNDAPATATAISDDVSAVIHRCLAKDQADRYEGCRELVEDLKLDGGLPSVVRKPKRARTATRFRVNKTVVVAASGIVLIAAGVLAVLLMRPATGLTLVLGRSTPLATTGALEDSPSWSPTGDRLVYHSRAAGNSDIWMVPIGGGAPANLTEDHDGDDIFPVWSPDGTRIAFLSNRSGGGLFVMPIPPAQPRKVASAPIFRRRPEWSADGSALYFTSGDTLKTVDLASGRTESRLLQGRTLSRFDLSLSPDGRLLAYVDALDATSEADQLWITDLSEGSAVVATGRHGAYRSPFWSPDGRALFFVSNLGGISDIWRQNLTRSGRPVGEPSRVTNGVGIRDVVLSPTANSIAFSKGHRIGTWNLWKVPIIKDRPATWADAEKLTDDSALIQFSNLSRDGQRLIFSSDRLGNQDLWLQNLDTGELSQLTSNPENDWRPRWSVDEAEIVFYSDRAGNRDIFVLSVESGFVRQLTDSPAEDLQADWAPDGQKIWFYSMRTGTATIFSVPAEGGTPTEHFRGTWPEWSPTGDQLVFGRPGNVNLFVPGGEPREMLSNCALGSWAADGRSVLCGRANDVYSISIDGYVTRLTNLTDRQGSLIANALSATEDFMVFGWDEEISDIWVMDVAFE